jgi:hypothetical protein
MYQQFQLAFGIFKDKETAIKIGLTKIKLVIEVVTSLILCVLPTVSVAISRFLRLSRLNFRRCAEGDRYLRDCLVFSFYSRLKYKVRQQESSLESND